MQNDRTGAERRTTVAEAAEILGINAEAVRWRIRRGTLPVEREGGTVYVLLEEVEDHRTTGDRPANRTRSDGDTLISEMRGTIDDLRAQLEAERQAHAEARRIIAGLEDRMPPQLEAPSDERGTPEASEPGSEGIRPRSDSAAGPTPSPEARDAFGQLSVGTYALGVLLLGSTGFIMPWGFGYDIVRLLGPGLPDYAILLYGAAWGLPLLIPIIFGYQVGRKPRDNNFWRHLGVTALLAAVVSFLPWLVVSFVQNSPRLLYETYSTATLMWLPVGLAFLSSALIGNANRRRAAGPTSVAGPTSGRWSPLTLQLIGTGGTILAAIITGIFAFFGNGA